jgi:multiple sugar transport system substrate-binding protein
MRREGIQNITTVRRLSGKALCSRRALLAQVAALATVLTAGACRSAAQPVAEPAARNACRGTIEFVSPWNVGTPTGDGLVLAGQDFAAVHPGCRAELVYWSGDNTAILEKLAITIAAGNQPAVTLVPAQQTPLWISMGVLQPLDTWAGRDKVSKELFFEGYWPQMVIGGKLWRLPFQIDVNFPWFWNKASFRSAGLDTERGPLTIAQLEELAMKLTRGAPGAHEQLGFVPWQLYGETNSLQSWAYAFGGDFYDPATDRVIANHPKTVEALAWMVEWAKRLGGYDGVQAELQAMGGWDTGLATGRIAMGVWTSQGLPGARQKNPQAEFGAGLFPGGPGVRPGEATWLSGRGIGMVTSIKDPEPAWMFIKWVSATPEGTLALVNRILATPGLKTSPGLAVLEGNAETRPFVEALRVAKHSPPGAVIPINIWGGNRSALVREVLQQQRGAREALDEITRSAQVEFEAERARQRR